MAVLPSVIVGAVLKVAGPKVVEQIEKMLAGDPVATNALNQEKPYQSRVVVGASTSVLGGLGYILSAVAAHGTDLAAYDWAAMVPAIIAVGGGVLALYGRLKRGLKPLFSRKA